MSDSGQQPGAGRPHLPTAADQQMIARWLAGPRSRALRRAAIGLRKRVLEVGAGHCAVTQELQRRAGGRVVCLDIEPVAWRRCQAGGHLAVGADARHLPFAGGCFDLVFYQNTLLWLRDPQPAVREGARVLAAGGALVAVEPDYGGMMEYPVLGLRRLWIEGLQAAGAQPLVGRMLPAACESAGLSTWVELAHLPQPVTPQAVRLLDDLPLDDEQRRQAGAIARIMARAAGEWSVFVHVPYFLIVATKP